jgi:hypothetical protein
LPLREPTPDADTTRWHADMALAGIPQLSLLLITFAIPLFVLASAAETFLRLHGQP